MSSICFALSGVGAYYFPQWLAVSDPIGPADAIIVLGGGPTRAIDAADFLLQGVAPVVYVTQPLMGETFQRLAALGIVYPRESDIVRMVLTAKRVPVSQIMVGAEQVISTVEEAAQLAQRLPASVQRVLLVTSPYHVRRTRWVFRRAMPERTIAVVASTAEPYPRHWWTRQDVARNVLLEGIKILFYLFGGRFYAH